MTSPSPFAKQFDAFLREIPCQTVAFFVGLFEIVTDNYSLFENAYFKLNSDSMTHNKKAIVGKIVIFHMKWATDFDISGILASSTIPMETIKTRFKNCGTDIEKAIEVLAHLRVLDEKLTFDGSGSFALVPGTIRKYCHYQVIPLPRDIPSRSVSHGMRPTRYLLRFSIIPDRLNGMHVGVWNLPESVIVPAVQPQDLDGNIPQQREPRIAVWPVSKSLDNKLNPRPDHILWEDDHDKGVGFFLTSPEEKTTLEELKAGVKNILGWCDAGKVDILVLPELSVPPYLEELIRRQLQETYAQRINESDVGHENHEFYPWVIVCGSFHEQVEDGDEVLSHVNCSKVLDYQGEFITLQRRVIQTNGQGSIGTKEWKHRKCSRFKLRDDESLRELRKEAGGNSLDGVTYGFEPLFMGDGITVVQTPIGRLTAVICLDFINTFRKLDTPGQRPLTDWILVPSATLKLTPFFEEGIVKALNGTSVVVVNACWFVESRCAWDKDGKIGAALAVSPNRTAKWQKKKPGVDFFELEDVHPFGKTLPPEENRTRECRPPNGDGLACSLLCSECLWIFSTAPLPESMVSLVNS